MQEFSSKEQQNEKEVGSGDAQEEDTDPKIEKEDRKEMKGSQLMQEEERASTLR